MAQEDAETAADAPGVPRGRRRALRKVLLLVLLLLAAALLLAWFERYRIADNILARELAARGIEARYRIDAISPTRQVLSDIAIGDPAAPDLTIEQLVVHIAPRFGFPKVTSVRMVSPRLKASYRDGELSLGALDPLVFTGSDEPFEFPDLVLAVEDGRARLDSDFGRVGLALEGSGHLQSGFKGILAANAPQLDVAGCQFAGMRLRGRVAIDAERPSLAGPLRLGAARCTDGGFTLANGEAQLDLSADRKLEGIDGEARIATGPLAIPGASLAGLSGDTAFTWRAGRVTARYTLDGRDLASGEARAAGLSSEGLLRTRDDFARIDLEGEVDAAGLAPGPALDDALATAQAASQGTLVAPLVARLRAELARQTRASRFAADFTARMADGRRLLLVPRAALHGAGGEALLSLSRGEIAFDGSGAPPSLAGEFATGGAGLPQIAGRAERDPSGATRIALQMEPYRAGEAVLALPALALRQASDGRIEINGRLLASGPLPGGFVRALELPLAGRWSPGGRLAMWPGCTQVRFSRLEVANLALDGEALTLCPPSGGAILSSGADGVRIAAGVPALDLSGRIGETPVTLATGPVGLAWPGALSARQVEVALGPPETASRFTIDDLTAEVGDTVAGRFEGAEIRLASVPLDLLGASGDWRYENGRLLLSNGAFALEDRQQRRRFEPLSAQGATLALEDNRITADAVLAEPRTGATVTRVAVAHDLATGSGHANLAVPGITFGNALQPTDLTALALGVVALVDGTVTGSGRIDWTGAGTVTSSGRFASQDLDFAAAFGPVEGAAGTVEFTDLLGLTTAPGQRLTLRSVNPGIEIYDGAVDFQLREGAFIDVQQARWPFLGGTLAIRPLTIAIGVPEQRGYILDIQGLEAAKFIERMELDNIAATGTLDGTIPVIFDKDGNGRLEDGVLASRPPGGNVAYVGQLTYEDMGAITNFAFDTLRSLDYRQMRIVMNGPLTGELATQVALEGVSQGADLEKNFITRRLANIPIRLVVNLRAPFYRLIGSLRSLYDPSAVRDPRDLGLIGADGRVLQRATDDDAVEARDAAREAEEQAAAEAARDEPPRTDIQPPESEPMP